jgi:hypothetical protein
MAGNFSTQPIGGVEREPVGQDPFTRPVFSFSPTEPSAGVLLLETGLPLLTEASEFIALEP